MHLFQIERTEDLRKYSIADGFTRYTSLLTDEDDNDLIEFLERQISEGKTSLLAVTDNTIAGFAVISDWKGLPDAKILDIIEVATPFRGRGIGTKMMQWISSKWDTLEILLAQSESGQEKRLIDFYYRFGFKAVSEASFTPVIMARIPPSKEKLSRWIDHIKKSYQEYSYEMFNTKRSLPIWGRRYAPWLNYNYDIYGSLLKEMYRMLDELTP